MGLSTNEEKHAPTLPKHRPNTTNNSRGGKTINRAERTGARGQKARPYVSANPPPPPHAQLGNPSRRPSSARDAI